MKISDVPYCRLYFRKALALASAWRKYDQLATAEDPLLRRDLSIKICKFIQAARSSCDQASINASDSSPCYRSDDSDTPDELALEHELQHIAREVRTLRPWFIRWICPLALVIIFAVSALCYGSTIAFQLMSNDGFVVTYYKGTDFNEQRFVWTENKAVRNYGEDSPALLVPRDGWSAKWEGVLIVPNDADYAFYAQSDDGVRLYIDDKLIIDYWGVHGWIPGMHGQATLKKGRHAIRIEHYDQSGAAAVRVRWAGGGIPDNTVIGTPYVLKQ